MRHLCIVMVLIAVVASHPQAQIFLEPAGDFKPHFSLKASGGWARWSMADWNNFYGFYLGQKQVYVDIVGNHFYWGRDAELELIYAFHPQLQVGIGFNHAWGTGKFDYENTYRWPEEPKDIRHDEISVAVTPLYFTLYTTGTSYPNHPYLGIGVGYYLSSFSQTAEYRLEHRVEQAARDSSNLRQGDMSANAIGYHVVMGTEYYLTKHIALLAEAKGRLVKISGYTGKVTETISEGTPVESDGEFTHYETPQQIFTGIQPAGTPIPAYLNPRPAELNFTGASLKLGIAYHF